MAENFGCRENVKRKRKTRQARLSAASAIVLWSVVVFVWFLPSEKDVGDLEYRGHLFLFAEAFVTRTNSAVRHYNGVVSQHDVPDTSFSPSTTSTALQVSFFSERTSTVPSNGDARDLPQAYVIERISSMPINDKLFERISNMCIDVFFKEQLTDAEFMNGDADETPKAGKL